MWKPLLHSDARTWRKCSVLGKNIAPVFDPKAQDEMDIPPHFSKQTAKLQKESLKIQSILYNIVSIHCFEEIIINYTLSLYSQCERKICHVASFFKHLRSCKRNSGEGTSCEVFIDPGFMWNLLPHQFSKFLIHFILREYLALVLICFIHALDFLSIWS